jgi:hypothetical protein
VANKYNDLFFRFLGDAKDLDQATRKANQALGSTDRESSKTKTSIGNLNRAVGGFVATIGAREVLTFAKDAAELAMQAEAAGESAEKVLGPALQTVHTNLDGVRQAMGLSSLELDTIIAQYGLLTEQYFETDEAQAAFIEDLVRMGGDLAAFKGDVSAAPEAVAAFGAALRGEFDPLEQFGVKLSEAAIQEEILRLKADPLNDTLSDQELRIAAIQSLINDKAAPALGSLAEAIERGDTKGSELNARLDDMKIKLGDKLQPALEGVLSFLLDVIEGWERLTTDFDNTKLGQWVQKLEPVGAVLKWIGDNLLNISAALNIIREAWDKVKGFWNTITSGIGSAAKWIGAIPGFAKGGTVPGPKGAPRMIVAHGGERVTNPDMGGGGGDGITYQINVTAGVGDANEIARQIVEALQVYNQTNGAIPVTVRSTE